MWNRAGLGILILLSGICPGQTTTTTNAPTAAPTTPPPAQYQLIRVRYRVVDLDGRPLENASISARLDADSSRKPPDRVIKVKAGEDEFAYTQDDSGFPVFSNAQHVNAEGLAEVPIIVYANRTEPIDYDLSALYKEANRNVLFAADRKHAYSLQDTGAIQNLRANVRRQVPTSEFLIALIAWIGISIMGLLLFFRGVYPRLLDGRRSIDLSRALCWSGALFVCLLALGLVYWWVLPHIFSVWMFLILLAVIWLAHLLMTVIPRRAAA